MRTEDTILEFFFSNLIVLLIAALSAPSRTIQQFKLILVGSSPEMQDASNNLAGLDAQLALWNFYNGVMKQPLQQNPILPFQPTRPQSQNSTIEGPLDLGKNSRKREGSVVETPPSKARVCHNEGADEDEVNESNASEDSDSDDEPECHLPVRNSSQGKASRKLPRRRLFSHFIRSHTSCFLLRFQ